jgi:hypothetical protein
VDVLFRNNRQDDLEALRRYIQDNTIDVALNYPDADLKLPAIVILLKSEAEEDAFLGNVMQPPTSVDRLGMPFHYDEPVGYASQSTATSAGIRTLVSGLYVVRATADTFLAAQGDFPLFDPFEETAYAAVIDGTGKGQRRQIIGVTPSARDGGSTSIQVTPNWDTILDDTSVVRIQGEGLKQTGEPSTIFSAGDVVTRLGAHYRVSYQLLVLANSPELAVYLYNIVKAIMFVNQDFMISQGFLNLQMSGSDFMPRADYLPDMAYQRALTLEFAYSFDVYLTGDYIAHDANRLLSKLRVSVTVEDPDVRVESHERIGIETELDL